MVQGNLTGRLNRKATACEAEKTLLDYQLHYRKAKRDEILKSVVLDGMPKTASVENTTEKSITDHLDDESFVQRCNYVISCLDDETSKAILNGLYIRPLNSVTDLMERVNLEHSAFYAAKEAALVAFAETWPPQYSSELLVYN